ncbi:hypothetical protein SAMN05192583_1280 [Sphingomonas gellani]|uniref:Uncharacterized protein n=1 Tax=Sphingomonas gellani TaxID=1166340 RepID=A0A1H8BCW3_9SPHN|nr:hypothetical protein [Sphingomonas gellani]SEM79838.1 hypothetical protein SAMN05192583_1280 [Sphingomonas gellani]
MNWRRVIAFVLWTGALVGLFFLIALVTLMGDCPENVIIGWVGGTTCSDRKHVIALAILIGFPALWLWGRSASFGAGVANVQ